MLKRLTYILLLLGLSLPYGHAQESHYFENQAEQLRLAVEYAELDLPGQARLHAEKYLTEVRGISENSTHNKANISAQNIYFLSGLKLDLPEAESKLKDHIAINKGNPQLTDPIFELASYYYNEKLYDDAITYFEMIDIDMLTEERMSELVFKKGYCHFVKKEFEKAQLEFSFSRDIKNKYFYPINYYNGMSEYFTGDYEDAVKSFRRVEGSSVYSKHIPYYICQIYFAQKEFDKLISYGERVIADSGTKKIQNIRQLLGQ